MQIEGPKLQKIVRFVLLLGGLAMAAVGAEAADVQYEKVGFDRLAAFKFEVPPMASEGEAPATGEEQIPAEIKALNGRKTLVTGYMLPVRLAKGKVTEFLLVKDPSMCCFGVVPNMNEWIVVKIPEGVPPVMDVPVTFAGELRVGAQFENGYMTGIYELSGERMVSSSS